MHFQGNEKSDHPSSPSFVPSIFSTKHLREMRNASDRFERWLKRDELSKEKVQQQRLEEQARRLESIQAEEETDSCNEDDKLPVQDLFLSSGTQTTKGTGKGEIKVQNYHV